MIGVLLTFLAFCVLYIAGAAWWVSVLGAVVVGLLAFVVYVIAWVAESMRWPGW